MVTKLSDVLATDVKLTPMMEQYTQIKKDHPGVLLLFRMGDFYELFFEDAETAAKELSITLTHRGKLGEFPIPMAGIPHHAASTYIDRLTTKGLKVAICEQVEDPKQVKGIVKRKVVQIVSPGIPYDLEKAKSHEFNYIASVWQHQDYFYLALLDFISGTFFGIKTTTEKELTEQLEIFKPKELLCFLGQWDNSPTLTKYLEASELVETNLSQECFDPSLNRTHIESLIPNFDHDQILKKNIPVLHSISALAYYVLTTQGLETLYHIKPFRMDSHQGHMVITLPTLIGLELFPGTREQYKNSLLGYLDRCISPMGRRELKNQFLKPLRVKEEIIQRQELIKFFHQGEQTLEDVRSSLGEVRDLERILAKTTTGKLNPTDLLNLAISLEQAIVLKDLIQAAPLKIFDQLSSRKTQQLADLAKDIHNIINSEIGASLDKGNLIREGASKKRDKLASICQDCQEEVERLESYYRKKTNITNLKVKHNNVHGYFIEVSKSHLNKVPKHFERKQTLVNCERFLTKKLTDFEKEVVTANEKLAQLEKALFEELVEKVKGLSFEIQAVSKNLGELDFYQGLAYLAQLDELVCPKISDKPKTFEVMGAWHPLIKNTIHEEFVTHDLQLNKKTFFGLITGPNMAGKTTVMREMAIIQFLTQLGSFVPARSAKVSICDYLFSRLGASDNIQKGQSTFMVEMSETAEIIRHATEKSFVVIDEIGRGTSTYDGLSIAWSLVEHFIQKIKCLTLFSTHYHELTELADDFDQAKNLTVETVNNNGNVRFLYRLLEASASQSYGIFVAKLAGLPSSILNRSDTILKNLEKDHVSLDLETAPITTPEEKPTQHHRRGTQLSFFPETMPTNMPEPNIPKYLTNLEDQVLSIDLLNLTPMQAMQKIQDLQQELPTI